jgi:hypothetical protein
VGVDAAQAAQAAGAPHPRACGPSRAARWIGHCRP